MRHININTLIPPEGWDESAQTALEDVEMAGSEERSTKISDHSDVWRSIKPELARLSHGKCWYCETSPRRSDMDVDHFRPKAKVAECPQHEGYWWLAFDRGNYRYSCVFCNRRRTDPGTGSTGGKSIHFPLLDEGTRVYSPDDDINNEQVCLLDPTNPRDPMLLAFDESGQAVPSFLASSVGDRLRVQESIELYHLNHSALKGYRVVLYNYIKGIFKKAVRYFKDNNPGALEEVFQKLLECLSDQAEYSAAARCYLMGQRSTDEDELAVANLLLQAH